MKVFSQFQHQILGIVLIFLLLFCRLCACHDEAVPTDDDDGFEDDSDGQETQSETLSTTTLGTIPLGPHLTSIHGDLFRRIECRGVDVTSLTYIACEGSIIDCRKKLPCLVNGTMCGIEDPIYGQEDCKISASGKSAETRSEVCLNLPISMSERGIVKCTSALPSSSSPSSPTPTIQRDATTIYYFYPGTDSRVHLLNADPSQPPLETLLNLKTGFGGEDILENRWSRKDNTDVFYTNEEIQIHCIAAMFFVDLNSLKIHVTTKSGTELQIDPALYGGPYGGTTGWFKTIMKFRVAKDIATLSCSGRRLDNSETIRRTWNFTVIDPPSPLYAKSPRGSDFSVVSKIGCILSLMGDEEQLMRRTVKKFLYLSLQEELRISSVIPFLRFQNITEGNYFCVALPPNPQWNSERFDFDPEVKGARIDKPDGSSSVVLLKGHGPCSLKCKYTGNPRPYVTWLHNGKEILYTYQTKISEGEGDFEESVLHLPIKNPDNPDNPDTTGISSEINSEIRSGLNSIEEYSCIVQNHVGADRLLFIIENEEDSRESSGTSSGSATASACAVQSKPEEKTSGLLVGVIILSLILALFIGLTLYLILTREKYRKNGIIEAQWRGNERGEQVGNVGEILDANSRPLAGPSHNHNHTEDTISNISHGVPIASKFRPGEVKYETLT